MQRLTPRPTHPLTERLSRAGAWTRVAAAPLAGGVLGLIVAAVSEVPDAARAAAVVTIAFVAAPCLVVADPAGDGRGASLRASLLTTLAAGVAVWCGVAVTSDVAALGAACVVAAATLLAAGVRSVARSLGVGDGTAAFCGVAVPFALAASLFVADPFVEWSRTGPGVGERADLVLSSNPLAAALDALTDGEGRGVDWQRSRFMYDGPPGAGGGLSVIGAYYPSRPASAWTTAGALALCGAALLALSLLRSARAAVASARV